MDVVCAHGAGLDVPKKTGMSCRVTPDPAGPRADGVIELKASGTMAEVGMAHVAMEDTGEYRRPAYNTPEGEVTIYLVNAPTRSRCRGRDPSVSSVRAASPLAGAGPRSRGSGPGPPVEPYPPSWASRPGVGAMINTVDGSIMIGIDEWAGRRDPLLCRAAPLSAAFAWGDGVL